MRDLHKPKMKLNQPLTRNAMRILMCGFFGLILSIFIVYAYSKYFVLIQNSDISPVFREKLEAGYERFLFFRLTPLGVTIGLLCGYGYNKFFKNK